MMAYMGTVTVILLNILIAQMSTTYTQAKKVARLEYDVDRILQLTRMERFPFLVNIRYVMRKSVNKFTPIANVQMRCVFFSSINEKADWASTVSDSERLFSVQKLSVKYYKEGGWISEMNLARGL